ncbi:MAG TPA: hypothetical protein VF273_02105 [Pelobium sp.]
MKNWVGLSAHTPQSIRRRPVSATIPYAPRYGELSPSRVSPFEDPALLSPSRVSLFEDPALKRYSDNTSRN